MNSKDPKLTALQFNEYINNRDIKGLSGLMAEDHTLTVREGDVVRGRESNTKAWMDFFNQFPDYKNIFARIESRDNLVIIIGYAIWSKESSEDHVIWTAKIEDDLVAEWRIYSDTEENRRKFNII